MSILEKIEYEPSNETDAFDPSSLTLGIPQSMENPIEKEFTRPAYEAEEKYQKELNQWRVDTLNAVHENTLNFDKFQTEEDEAVRKQRLILGFLDAQFDSAPENMIDYEVSRGAAAEKMGWKNVKSDDDFFARMQERSVKRKESEDLEVSLREGARVNLLGGNLFTFDDWITKNGAEPRSASYYLMWKDEQDRINEHYGPVLLDVRNTFSLMRRGDEWLSYASALARKMDDDEKEIFLGGLREIAVLYPTPEIENAFKRLGINIWTSINRGVSGAVRNAGHGFADEIREGGTYGFAKFFGSNEAAARERENAARDRAWAASIRKEVDFIADVRSVFEKDYDPVRPLAQEGSWIRDIEEGAYDIPGAFTTSAMAVIPYFGLPLSFSGMSETARQKYRQRLMANGMDRERAGEVSGAMGLISAAPNMMLEHFQSGGLFGKLAGFDKVFKVLDGKVKNRLARGVIKFGIGSIAETGTELSQDFVEELVQDTANVFDAEIPDIEWKNGKDGVFDGYFSKFLTTFVAVAPMSIGVATGGLSAEKRAEAFRKISPLERKAFGITQHDSDAIDNAKTPGELVEATNRAVENHDPYSEEAKDATQELAEQIQRVEEAKKDLQRLGAFPIFQISKKNDGIDVINPKTGESIGVAENSSQAAEMAFAYMELQDIRSQHDFDELAWMIEASVVDVEQATDPDAKVELRSGDKMSTERMVLEDEESFDVISMELERLEQLYGGDGKVSKRVFGSSKEIFENDQKSYLQKLYEGSSVFTLVHERGHAKLRQAINSGAMTLDEVASFFKKFDSALEEETDKKGRTLRFIPEGFESPTFRQLDEAVAEFNELLLLHSRKGKKSRMRDMASKQLSAMVKARVSGATKMKAFVDAMREFFGINLSRHLHMKRAIAKGTIKESDIEAFRAKLQGSSEQEEHDKAVKREYQKMLDSNTPFSIGNNASYMESIESRDMELAKKKTSSPESEEAIAILSNTELPPVSDLSSFKSAPNESGDVSHEGDGERNTSFSIGEARENYKKILQGIKETKEAIKQAELYLRINGGSAGYGGRWTDLSAAIRKRIADEYERPAPGEVFDYNGNESWISDDGDRVIWKGGRSNGDPVDWIDSRLITSRLIVELREKLANHEANLYLLEEDFDPDYETRQKEKRAINKRRLNKKASTFAALLDSRDAEIKNASKSFVARLWNTYAKHDSLFQFGKTESKSARDIAEAVSIPGKLISADESYDSVRFISSNGSLTIKDAETDRPYISASNAGSKGKKGGGGSQLYVAAMDWIHNNGKRIKDDPDGISSINAIRRTSNFFASAIRWGTTKHLKAHVQQEVGKWTKNDILNTALLAQKEMDNVFSAVPEARNLTFDFSRAKFLQDGEEITEKDIEKIVDGSDPSKSGIGISTLQRAVITSSAIQEFQRGTTESIVESAESKLADSLTGISYSISTEKYDSNLFSIGRASVTPNESTNIFQTKDGGLIGPASFSIQAYHGTPHKVDKFSIEKIGTGEGAQVYGWGLYFAESREVAKIYHETLTPTEYEIDGERLDLDNPKHLLAWSINEYGDIYNAVEYLQSVKDPATQKVAKEALKIVEKTWESEDYPEMTPAKKSGAIYTVELNVDQDELIDWDKPLSEQSEKVQKAIRFLNLESDDGVSLYSVEKDGLPQWIVDDGKQMLTFSNETSAKEEFQARQKRGQDFYRSIKGTIDSDKSASLKRAGIKGIRYLDGNSRSQAYEVAVKINGKDYVPAEDRRKFSNKQNAEEYANSKSDEGFEVEIMESGSYNYVIFSDDDITITHENGKKVDTGTSFSISPAQDAEYMAAVESGDMEAAQRMVYEAARDAGYNKKVYHGTNSDFDVFNHSKIGKNGTSEGIGFYTTDDKSFAEGYMKLGDDGARLVEAYVRGDRYIDNTYIPSEEEVESIIETYVEIEAATPDAISDGFTDDDIRMDIYYDYSGESISDMHADLSVQGLSDDSLAKAISKVLDIDGFKTDGYEGRKMGVYVSLESNYIKKADPVTYDKSGNVIPLSLRFDENDDRISYSIGDTQMKETLISDVFKRIKNPETRVNIMSDVARRLSNIKRDKDKIIRAFGKDLTQKAIVDPRSMKDMRKEASDIRKRIIEDEENSIYDDFGEILSNEELTRLSKQPVTARILDEGGFKSRTSARREDVGDLFLGGEYDGTAGLPPIYFGGTETPDQLALILYNDGLITDNSFEAMYEAIDREMNTVAKNKEHLNVARQRMKAARQKAQKESQEWLDNAIAEQKRDNNPREQVRRSLVTLDAILMALPPKLRGDVGGHTQLAKLNSNEKRLEFLQERVEKLDTVVEKWIKTDTKKQIGKLFDRAKVKKNAKGIPKANLPADFTDRIQRIKKLSNLDKAVVDDRIEKLAEKIDMAKEQADADRYTNEMVELMAFGAIDSMNSTAMVSFYENLASIVNTGKMVKEFMDEIHKAEIDELKRIVNHDVTGGGGPMLSSEAKLKEKQREWYKGLSKFHRQNISFEWLMNSLARKNKEVGTLESETHNRLSVMVHVAQHREKVENMRVQEEYRDFLSSVFGGKKGLKLSDAIERKMMTEIEKTGVIRIDYGGKGSHIMKTAKASNIEAILSGADKSSLGFNADEWASAKSAYMEIKAKSKDGKVNANRNIKYKSPNVGRPDNLTLSQSQAINLTMLFRQEHLRESMIHEGYTEKTMKKMEKFLSPEARKIRDWLTSQYEENYHRINEVFRAQYGVSLPKTYFYSPVRRIADGYVKDMAIDSHGGMAMSTNPNFLISRTKNFAEVDQTADALSIYMEHMVKTNHYVALSKPIKTLRSIFSDKEVKKNIKDYAGDSLLTTINERIEWFADGGNRKATHIKWMDDLRAAHVYTSLSYNWALSIKQLLSLPAFAFDMSFKDFGKYSKMFWSDPVKHFKEMAQTDYVRTRFKEGYERDVIDGLKKEGSAIMKALKAGMIFTKSGDIVPVMIGGWMMKKRSFDMAKAKNMSDADAEAKSIIDFEMSSDRAQQAGNLKDLSSFQAGASLFKLFTMYKTSQRQYYANVYESLLDFKAGKKGAGKEFARRFFIGQFVLPLTFQFVSDTLKAPFEDDDDRYDGEDYLRAMLMGPLNGLFIAGNFAELITSGVTNAAVWAEKIPIMDGATKAAYGMKALWKGKFAEGVDDVARGIGKTIPGVFSFYDIFRKHVY